MNLFKVKTDEELLAFLKAGNVAAFEALYKRYWSKLYIAAYRRLRDKEVCEEIVQDFFTGLWTKRQTLEIHTSFNAYVTTSVKYQVFSHYHKNESRKTYQEKMVFDTEAQDALIENLIDIKTINRALDERVEALPEKCRAVYVLSRKEHLNNKEIAQTLGISEKTVENHMTKALRNLRSGIKDLI